MAGSRNNRRVSYLQLLELVRAALWNRLPDLALFSESQTDWDEIGRLAMEQTVGGLAITSALSLPDRFQPAIGWRRKAYAFIEGNRRTHLLVEACVAESVKRLREAGIKPVLLKGQAYARAYPSEDRRQCGDIDLYVGSADYHRAFLTAKGMGWEVAKQFDPEAKHCEFTLHGVRIELHRIAGQLSPSSIDRKFQEWSHMQLTSSFRSISVNSNQISVPTVIFDVVFVFMHLYLHFLSGGIGLRHLCDWIMLLHKHRNEINLTELEMILNELRLMKGWCQFAPIAVEQLGLPETECPFYSACYRRKSETILSSIFKEGNFGRSAGKNSPRPEGYYSGKIYSFRNHSIRFMRKFPIDPYTITRTYISYIYKGLAQIFNDTIIGKQIDD